MKVFSVMTRMLAGLSLAAVVAMVSGCGELVSGANLKPTVKFKPSSAAGAAAEAIDTATASSDAATSGGTGTVKGKVEVTGAFATLPPLYTKGADVKDAAICGAADAADESALVKDGGLANVFIYLKKAPKVSGEAIKDASVVFDQKNCVFKPHAMIVRVGQTVRVLNSDAAAHNTHTYGKKTAIFNSVVSPNEAQGVPLVYKLAEQDPISVGCDIHPWMRAYHLPIDHPFAALSAEDGTFEIKDIPAGKHEFKVWHETAGLLEKGLLVTVKPGDNELSIKVSPAQLAKGK